MRKSLKRWLAGLTAAITACSSAAVWKSDTAQKVKAADTVLAFPGAVGGGSHATGGRGGEVYHVTNLNDSGEGSFRDAVSKSNRIVVFDVSGTIELKSNILCQSNITIAGQTAPGGSGITLKNYKLGMSGDNIICRFISSRPGPYASTSSGNDAWGGAKGSNSIIDHCSMGFTTDEQWGLYSNNEYYTVQYSVIGPADSWGGHSKGVHGFGLMMGKGYLTFDHNLIIHNVSRNFRGKVEGQETADFTNNVIYNWAYQTAYGTIGHLNYVNNTLKMGNGTTGGLHYVDVDSTTKPQNFKIYLSGNQMLNKDDSIYAPVTDDNWAGVILREKVETTMDALHSDSPFETIVDGVNVSTATTCESAEASYEHVLSYAGNGISPTTRTAIDLQCAEEARTGTGYHSGTASYDDANDTEKANIDKYQIQCGVTYDYPEAVLTKTITDADNDGMDDDWELARGLDPNDPTDVNGDYCGLGYTNIEYYINDLTVDAFPEGVVTPSPETAVVEAASAFERIEAEDYAAMEGIREEETSDTDGNLNIGFIENGDYVMYKRLDFEDGAKSFTVRASGNACTMQLYLDNLNTPVAYVPFAGTNGFSDWQDVTFNIPKITDVHNLYIRFVGGEGYLMNLNWFTFGKETVPINGTLVNNLLVNDAEYASGWRISYQTAPDSLIFGDRDFTYAAYPEALIGAEAVLTACDSKYYEGDTAASFWAGADIIVYIGLDNRVETVPAWMADYTKTDMTLTSSNEVIFDVYSKAYSAGETVKLGPNGQSYNCVNYTVNVMAQDGETPTKPEVTEPPVEETTETGIPEETTEDVPAPPTEDVPDTSGDKETDADTPVYGDVDGSGVVDIVDVIALNKFLLLGEPLEPEYLANADVDNNGTANATDSLIILKYVVKIITSLPV